MKIRSERFAIVPQFVVEAATGNALKLYAILYGLGSFERPERTISRAALAETMVTSVDTVDRLLRELTDIGAVAVRRNKTKSGSWGASTYVLATEGSRRAAARGSRKDAARVAAPLRPLPNSSSEKEPQRTPPGIANDAFDEFWRLYPRRTGKDKAKAAFEKRVTGTRKLAAVPADVILGGARRFASDPNLPPPADARFIPLPATWLNEGRWADDPLPPRGRGSLPSEDAIVASMTEARSRRRSS